MCTATWSSSTSIFAETTRKTCGRSRSMRARIASPRTITSMRRRCFEQDEHFKHLSENPTYIRPEDWPQIDSLVDWLIEKNKAGYQMVNSVQRLQEMKAFIRMASGADLKRLGWNGDGTGGNGNIAKRLVE